MRNKEERYITISNSTQNWVKRSKMLLAGQFCMNPNDTELKKKFEIKILKNEFLEPDNAEKEIKYCNEIYEKLLKEFSDKLNSIHKINWSVRSWRILIGPWLNRYIAVINNRLNILLEAKKDFKVIFKKIHFKDQSLLSSDLLDFSLNSLNDVWNEKLIRRINDLLENKLDTNYFNKINLKKFENKELSLLRKINFKLCGILNYIFGNLFLKGKNKFFFYNIYLGSFFLNFKLCLKLRQIPIKFFFFNDIKKVQADIKERNKLNFEIDSFDDKEKIIRTLLKEMTPTLYVEGFSNYKKYVDSHSLSKNYLKIFTCNLWADTVVKFWVAEKINLGSKLIYGQHGASYGLIRCSIGDLHDRKISDYFVSWGQNYENDKKNISGIVQSVIKNKNEKKLKKKFKILLITTLNDLYVYRNEIKNPNLLWDNVTIISKFIDNIKNLFPNEIIYKSHPLEFKSSFPYSNFIKDNHRNIIFSKTKNLDLLMRETSLSIFFYLGTDFLRNLILNRPSIVLLTKQNSDILTDEAKKYLKFLEEVKIIFYDKDLAEDFIKKNIDNIENWWNNDLTQDKIKLFCDKFARNPDNSFDIFVKLLKNLKN